MTDNVLGLVIVKIYLVQYKNHINIILALTTLGVYNKKKKGDLLPLVSWCALQEWHASKKKFKKVI